jgi:hypothetical protein
LLQHYEDLLNLIQDSPGGEFDAQIAALYGLALPPRSAEGVSEIHAQLDALLPGAGALMPRLISWQRAALIPEEHRKAVFERALAACKDSTQHFLRMPLEDQLDVVWGTRHGAAAWHSFHGEGRSTLMLAPRALTDVSAVLELACHEGYPGHHAQYVLLENARLGVEDTVVLTRSPDAVLREGAAMLAVEMSFSPTERLRVERDVLFPLAGLDADQAERHLEIHSRVRGLQGLVPHILADFLEGRLNFSEARMQLETQALVSGAPELLQYAQTHGTYLAGYTLQADALRGALTEQQALHDQGAWAALLSLLVVEGATAEYSSALDD